MWGFVNEYLNYIKAIGIGIAVCCIFYAGFHLGNNRYLEYKASVEATAKAQEEKNKSVEAQHALVNKGIQDAYEAKLAALRNYYGRMQLNPSGSSVSGISPTPKGTDAETAYPTLAGQCAATTAQLTSLQDWVNQQIGIK